MPVLQWLHRCNKMSQNIQMEMSNISYNSCECSLTKRYCISATVSYKTRILQWCSVLQYGEFQAIPSGLHLASCATPTAEMSKGQYDTGVHSNALDSQWVLVKENNSCQISKYYSVTSEWTLACKGRRRGGGGGGGEKRKYQCTYRSVEH